MSNAETKLYHKTIAVLGTGIMGAPVARNLRKHGFSVRVWNRTRAKAETLASAGLDVADSPREAVEGADIVITMLKDGVGVNAIEELAGFAKQHGLRLYDAPVQGSRQPAEQGQLVVIASGPAEDRDTVQPVFEAIGKRTVWVSDQIGAASRLKLALNSWVFALTHGAAESLAIAKGLGVDPALVADIVKGGPLDSAFFQSKAASILADDYTASFSIANAFKDAQLVMEAVEQAGLTADVAAAGLQRFRRAIEAGHQDKDMAASALV